jgi:type IV pilus assembly protein PilM
VLRTDRILAVDIGASKLVVAEFFISRKGLPQLVNYGIVPLGIAPDRETESSAYIVSALRDVMKDRGIRPAPLHMTISGQAVFPRYVRLPSAATSKLDEIVRYEAEQNVPFAIEEVVWDYQLFRSEETSELSVMLVAVKIENVSRLTDCIEAVHMEPAVVDAAPLALYNTVRYSYPDQTGCSLLLDIGARSSNLIFIENERVFCRSVPVAGNTITQEIAKEFDIPFEEAEQLKKDHAVVALGGTYGEADPTVDRVSKIVRNVITRLHAEVNRSINFYRSQQGGSPPSHVLLTGGSSVIRELDTFFRDKLRVPVSPLNPFARIAVGSRISEDQVAADAHLMGEVVGVALRRGLKCPLEINLMPPEIVVRKSFRRKQPYFFASAASVVLLLLSLWGYAHRVKGIRDVQLQEVTQRISRIQLDQAKLQKALDAKKEVKKKDDSLATLVADRTVWLSILEAIHGALLEGMWITAVTPVIEKDAVVAIEVSGRGFSDKIAPVDNPFEVFRDRLRAAPLFTDKTEIIRMPAVAANAPTREVTMQVVLKNPLSVQ